MLSDGSVIPSYMGVGSMGIAESMGDFHSLHLMVGEVIALILPTDDDSVSKKFIEYRVAVQYRTGQEPVATTEFSNCLMVNLFGGLADKLQYTLRSRVKRPIPGETFGNGSKVLVLCLNGESSRAYIIGGIVDPIDTKDSDQGHNLFFEFNGAQSSINDDGELKILFRGKTQIDGTLDSNANSKAEGSYIFFDKDGGIKTATPKDDQYIFIDHKNTKLSILANSAWEAKVANGGLDFEVKKDIVMKSSSGAADLEVANNVTIKSSGVLVGNATDQWPLFSTYRTQESTMNNTLSSQLGAIGGALASAGAALSAAGAAMIVPVAGAVAAAPVIASAGAALASLTAMFTSMAAAIQVFEAQAARYLSLKNKND